MKKIHLLEAFEIRAECLGSACYSFIRFDSRTVPGPLIVTKPLNYQYLTVLPRISTNQTIKNLNKIFETQDGESTASILTPKLSSNEKQSQDSLLAAQLHCIENRRIPSRGSSEHGGTVEPLIRLGLVTRRGPAEEIPAEINDSVTVIEMGPGTSEPESIETEDLQDFQVLELENHYKFFTQAF
eukprot:g66288.t1